MVCRTLLFFLLCSFTFADQFNKSLSNVTLNRQKRQILHKSGNVYLWDHDVTIKYAFDDIVESKIPWIREVFNFLQSYTCLSFQHTIDQDYDVLIKYDDSSGCRSVVGRYDANDSTNYISLGWLNCVENVGIVGVLHEILHTLGMSHSMNEMRSKEFMKIEIPGFQPNPQLRNYGIPFDTGSIMLYADEGNSPARERFKNAYNSVYLPFSDLLKINNAYGCQDLCDPEDLFRCSKHMGIPNSRDCSTCICPNGFEGPTCTDRRRSMFDNPPCGDTLYATEQPQILTIDIYESDSFINWRFNNSTNILHPNVCVWHIRAPLGKIVSVKVNGEFDPFIPEDERYIQCLRSNLEVQVENFDLQGYVFCSNYDIAEIPTLYSNGNRVVIIASSGWDALPALNITYEAVG